MHESEKWKGSRSVVSDPQQPRGLQPSRLLHPWDFPLKSTGVGCHCLLRISLHSPEINLSLLQTPTFWNCLASLCIGHMNLHSVTILIVFNPIWLLSLYKGETWTQASTDGRPCEVTGRTPYEHEKYPQAKERGLEQVLPSQLSQVTNSADTLILDLWVQELWDNKFLFKPPTRWYFVMATIADEYKWSPMKHTRCQFWWWKECS